MNAQEYLAHWQQGEEDQMRTKQQRIEMIQDNLKENARMYKEGRRLKSTYLVCKKDGEKALAEIRAGR